MSDQVDVLVPKITKPLRVIFLFEATSGWYQTTKQEKHEAIIPKLNAILESWKANGSTLLGTLDADVFSAGRASTLGWHACFLYDVPDFDTVSAMTHAIRDSELDRYFRLEAIIGRKFFLLEE